MTMIGLAEHKLILLHSVWKLTWPKVSIPISFNCFLCNRKMGLSSSVSTRNFGERGQ